MSSSSSSKSLVLANKPSYDAASSKTARKYQRQHHYDAFKTMKGVIIVIDNNGTFLRVVSKTGEIVPCVTVSETAFDFDHKKPPRSKRRMDGLRTREFSSDSGEEGYDYEGYHHKALTAAADGLSSSSYSYSENDETSSEPRDASSSSVGDMSSNSREDDYEMVDSKMQIEAHMDAFKTSFGSDSYRVETHYNNYFDDRSDDDDDSYEYEYETNERGLVPINERTFVSCNACGVSLCGKERVGCDGCGMANYCNEKCQALDWEVGHHEKHCDDLKKASLSEFKSIAKEYTGENVTIEGNVSDATHPTIDYETAKQLYATDDKHAFKLRQKDGSKALPEYLVVHSYINSNLSTEARAFIEADFESRINFKLPWSKSSKTKGGEEGEKEKKEEEGQNDSTTGLAKKKKSFLKRVVSKTKKVARYVRHPNEHPSVQKLKETKTYQRASEALEKGKNAWRKGKDYLGRARDKTITFVKKHGADLQARRDYLISRGKDSPEVLRQKEKLRLAQEAQKKGADLEFKEKKMAAESAEAERKLSEHEAKQLKLKQQLEKKRQELEKRQRERSDHLKQEEEKRRLKAQKKTPPLAHTDDQEDDAKSSEATVDAYISDLLKKDTIPVEPTATQKQIIDKLGIGAFLIGPRFGPSSGYGWRPSYAAYRGVPPAGRIYGGSSYHHRPVVVGSSGFMRPFINVTPASRVLLPRMASPFSRHPYYNDYANSTWYRNIPRDSRHYVDRAYRRYYGGRRLFPLWSLPLYATLPALPFIALSMWSDEARMATELQRLRLENAHMYNRGYEIVPDYENKRFVWVATSPEAMQSLYDAQ